MESKAHIDLVNRIIEYVKKNIPEENYDLIQSDSNGSNSDASVIGDFIPDVYYRDSEQLIIGEAKTLNDFDKLHSRAQFTAYMKESMLFDGATQLVVAIPWQLSLTAKNYFKRIKMNNDIEITVVIINEMGKEMIV